MKQPKLVSNFLGGMLIEKEPGITTEYKILQRADYY